MPYGIAILGLIFVVTIQGMYYCLYFIEVDSEAQIRS